MQICVLFKGMVYVTAGAICFFTGVKYGYLPLAVCGVALGVYTIMAIAVVVVTTVCWRNALPLPVMHESLFSGIGNGERLFSVVPAHNDVLFPFCMTGTVVYAVAEYRAALSGSVRAGISFVRIRIRLNRHDIQSISGGYPRGCYWYERQYIEVQDAAAFFSIRLYARNTEDHIDSEQFSVHFSTFEKKAVSAKIPFVSAAIPVRTGCKVSSLSLVRSTAAAMLKQDTSLYEVRPYTVGDDSRAIHWKQYARTGVLCVKHNGFKPPVADGVTVFIEEPICSRRRYSNVMCRQTLAAFDILIGHCAFMLQPLLYAGVSCMIVLRNDTGIERLLPFASSCRYNAVHDSGGQKLRICAVNPCMRDVCNMVADSVYTGQGRARYTGSDASDMLVYLLSLPAVRKYGSVPLAALRDIVPKNTTLLYFRLADALPQSRRSLSIGGEYSRLQNGSVRHSDGKCSVVGSKMFLPSRFKTKQLDTIESVAEAFADSSFAVHFYIGKRNMAGKYSKTVKNGWSQYTADFYESSRAESECRFLKTCGYYAEIL